MSPIIDEERSQFEYEFPKAKLKPKYTDEVTGLQMIKDFKTALLFTTRNLKDSEIAYLKSKSNVIPSVFPIGYDGLAFIVNKQNNDTCITVKDIKRILTGKATKWSDIVKGSKRGNIEVIFDNTRSATTNYVVDSVLHGAKMGAKIMAAKTSKEVIDYVDQNPGSIGVIGSNWLNDRRDSTNTTFKKNIHVMSVSIKDKATPMNSWKPYQAYLLDGRYPFVRTLYAIVVDPHKALPWSFANYISGAKYSYDAMSEAYATSQDMNEKDREMLEDSKLSIIETLNNSGFDAQKYFKDVAEYNIYNTGLTVKDTLGDINTDDYQFMADTIMPVMTIGDYNSVARLYGNSTYELNDDEYIIVADYKNMVMIRNQALKKGITLSVNGKEYKPRYNECKDGFVQIGVQNMNDGILVVPDNAVKPQQVRNMGLSADYRADTKEERYSIETQLDNLMKNISFKKSFISWNSRIELAESSVGHGALVTFIALYLGIIFLISSAAILALRELSDSADNKERYGMLRKLGVDERMIDMALFKQIGIFFAFPLILALIHSVFGIKFINIILATMGMSSMAASIGLTLAFVAVIYGGYFLITYLCSRSIIRPVR